MRVCNGRNRQRRKEGEENRGEERERDEEGRKTHLGEVDGVNECRSERSSNTTETEVVGGLWREIISIEFEMKQNEVDESSKGKGEKGEGENRTLPTSCIVPPLFFVFPTPGCSITGGPHFASSKLPKSLIPNRSFGSSGLLSSFLPVCRAYWKMIATSIGENVP
jgi:hypothetical protein